MGIEYTEVFEEGDMVPTGSLNHNETENSEYLIKSELHNFDSKDTLKQKKAEI